MAFELSEWDSFPRLLQFHGNLGLISCILKQTIEGGIGVLKIKAQFIINYQ